MSSTRGSRPTTPTRLPQLLTPSAAAQEVTPLIYQILCSGAWWHAYHATPCPPGTPYFTVLLWHRTRVQGAPTQAAQLPFANSIMGEEGGSCRGGVALQLSTRDGAGGAWSLGSCMMVAHPQTAAGTPMACRARPEEHQRHGGWPASAGCHRPPGEPHRRQCAVQVGSCGQALGGCSAAYQTRSSPDILTMAMQRGC